VFTTRLELGLAIAVFALLSLVGYGLYERHQGAVGCVNADAKLSSKAVAVNTTAEATQHIANAAEEENRAQALTAPIAPTPRVPPRLRPPALAPRCNPVPEPGPAPAPSAPGPDVRAAGEASLVLEDADTFVRSDVQRARAADIEVRDRDKLLQDLQALCTARGVKR
jgi:hypothetical protein